MPLLDSMTRRAGVAVFKDKWLKLDLALLVEEISAVDFTTDGCFTKNRGLISRVKNISSMVGIHIEKNKYIRLFSFLGLMHRKNKQYYVAKGYFDKAISSYLDGGIDKPIEYADVLENTSINSILSKSVSDIDGLRLKKAYEIKKYFYGDDDIETLSTLMNYGVMLVRRFKYSEALAIFQRLLKSELVEIDPHKKIICLLNLGNIFKCTSAYSLSLDTLFEGLTLMGSNQSVDVALFLNNIGRVALKKTDYNYAERKFHEAEKICLYDNSRLALSHLCQSYQGKASLFLKKGDPIQAQLYIDKCLKIQEDLYQNDSDFSINTYNIQKNIKHATQTDRKKNYTQSSINKFSCKI